METDFFSEFFWKDNALERELRQLARALAGNTFSARLKRAREAAERAGAALQEARARQKRCAEALESARRALGEAAEAFEAACGKALKRGVRVRCAGLDAEHPVAEL